MLFPEQYSRLGPGLPVCSRSSTCPSRAVLSGFTHTCPGHQQIADRTAPRLTLSCKSRCTTAQKFPRPRMQKSSTVVHGLGDHGRPNLKAALSPTQYHWLETSRSSGNTGQMASSESARVRLQGVASSSQWASFCIFR